MKKKPTQDQLLRHYSQRQPKKFTQIDGFSGDTEGDEDGHTIYSSETYELMSGAYAVRVLVTDGTHKQNVLTILDKIRAQIANKGIPFFGERVKLAIKLNNAICNDPCAMCLARTDPDGVDLFLEESWALVCDECGDKHAPELMAVLRAGRNLNAISSQPPREALFGEVTPNRFQARRMKFEDNETDFPF